MPLSLNIVIVIYLGELGRGPYRLGALTASNTISYARKGKKETVVFLAMPQMRASFLGFRREDEKTFHFRGRGEGGHYHIQRTGGARRKF